MKYFLTLYLLCVVLCGFAPAETRVWEDTAGNRYEAEFVRELFDKITLREASGKEHRVDVEELSEHDQKYIRVMVPPVMEINLVRRTDIKPKPVELSDDDSDTVTLLTTEVRIKKVSHRPFTSGLKAEVYFIAKEVDGDNYILLDRSESDFLFTQENTHKFETEEIEIMIYREYNHQLRGEQYLGYLVAVSDAHGNVVRVETDINWLADKTEALRELYTRGNASRHIRHFDKNGQKTDVPRPRYYSSRNH